MKEYLGQKSKIYQQTRGKRFILIPAIRRHLQTVPRYGTLLDVGCGIGDFYELAKGRDLSYCGLDKSPDMINRAKEEYPKGHYIACSATNFSRQFKQKFDVVLLSMLFPSIGSQNEMVEILLECKKVLKVGGKILIGEPYPTFDGYMQSYLFKRKGVKTKFTGYFSAGTKVNVAHKLSKGKVAFNDHHWTLNSYMKAIKASDLNLTDIDECPPGKEAFKAGAQFYKERQIFPSYLLLELKTK